MSWVGNFAKKARRAGSWFQLRYDPGNENASNARNTLLVVVALIIAVTFQAGANPPGGVWDETDSKHAAGTAIYADKKPAFAVFVIANTLALSTSILVLLRLTYKFPFHFELWIASTAMFVSYMSAVYAVAPRQSMRFRFICAAAFLPFGIRFMLQVYHGLTSKDGTNIGGTPPQS